MALGLCRFTNAAGGTVDWTYPGPAIDMQSPASAGAVNGTVYQYYAQSLDMAQWEIGTGAYNSSTGVFARTTIAANSLGTTAKISFLNPPQIAVYDLYAAIPIITSVPLFKVQLATQQSIASSTFTKINFDMTVYDNNSWWDGTNFFYKPQKAGYYRFSWSVYGGSSGSGTRILSSLWLNGSRVSEGADVAPPSVSGGGSTGSDLLYLNGSTDSVAVEAYITATTPIVGATGFAFVTSFSGEFVGT